MSLIDDKNRFDPDTAIKEVKKEFRSHHQQLLVKHEKISTHTLEKAFTCVVPNPKDVCKEITNSLDEEIA